MLREDRTDGSPRSDPRPRARAARQASTPASSLRRSHSRACSRASRVSPSGGACPSAVAAAPRARAAARAVALMPTRPAAAGGGRAVRAATRRRAPGPPRHEGERAWAESTRAFEGGLPGEEVPLRIIHPKAALPPPRWRRRAAHKNSSPPRMGRLSHHREVVSRENRGLTHQRRSSAQRVWGEELMSIAFGPRRAEWIKVAGPEAAPLTPEELGRFEAFDLFYRSLCALLYNYVPQSGTRAGRSPRAASWPAFSSTPWTTSWRSPTARTPTSSRTRPATRRWASTRCGRCATRWRASASPELLPGGHRPPAAAGGPARLPPQPPHPDPRSS